jgi:hypothetical protein
MTVTEQMAAITTTEQAEAHFAKCPSMIKCKHETDKVNEYGDCYDCDGEGRMMCPCQDWTDEYLKGLA